jgi:glutamate-1-semialdehyde 2,1-aminomutase
MSHSGHHMHVRTKSREIFEASCQVIPGGVNSPVRAFTGLNMTPMVAVAGEGAIVRDADGHAYIDYCGSWGALILGHAHPAVVKAAEAQIRLGSTFGMATPFEWELAQKIRHHLPSMEKIRFVSSGTEATMSAIRLARGFTGKSTVVKFEGHYHGHSDGLLVKAGSGVLHINKEASSKGVPTDYVRHTVCLPFNDIQTCRDFLRHTDTVAAVILEPIAGNMGLVVADSDFLHMLREETAKKGIVLIFDEVITGFRVGLQGAQGYFGIAPDLTCLGKIIGGGFPAAAFGGSSAIMDHLAPLGEVYQAGTLSGNPVAMRAGLATLEELEKPGFYEALEQKTQILAEGIRRWMKERRVAGCVAQQGSMFTVFFGPAEVRSKVVLDEERYRQFFSHLFQRWIYLAPAAFETNFVSSAHTQEQIEGTLRIIEDYL